MSELHNGDDSQSVVLALIGTKSASDQMGLIPHWGSILKREKQMSK